MPRPRRPPPPPRGSAPGWRPLVVALAVALVYANSLSGPFLFDDEAAIVENPAIRSVRTVTSERFNSPLAGRPVAGLTFALNFAASGLDVTGYHATNVAIHLSSALLLFGLVRRTLVMPRLAGRYGAHSADVAAAVALVWAVHPLNTEAVNYVTQRTELLFGFFFLLTLYAVARSHASRNHRLWQGLAVAAAALGMASKEAMVTAPVVVLIYERTLVYTSWTGVFSGRRRVYFYTALALTWVVLALLVLPGPRSNSAGFSTGVSVWTYLLNQASIIVRYLRLAVWPRDLVVNYGPPIPLTLTGVLPHVLLLAGLGALTLAALRRQPALGFLGAWFFITLAPSSSLVPIATEVGAERRMYIPLIALVAALVAGACGLPLLRQAVTPRAARMLTAIVVILLGAMTAARNREYTSAMTIAEQDLRRRPNDYTHGAVGSELARLGRDADAIAELRIGARTDPRARYNLGVSLFNTKQYEEAIHHLTWLAGEHPMREEVPWARRVAGHAYSLQGKWPEAITQFRMVLAMTPGDVETRRLYADALNQHGIELGTAGEHVRAAEAFRASLAQAPDNAGVRHNLATALLDSGDLPGAEAEARTALARNPGDAGLHNLLGRAQAMQGRFSEAMVHLEAAVARRPDDPALRDDLDRVRAFAGRPSVSARAR